LLRETKRVELSFRARSAASRDSNAKKAARAGSLFRPSTKGASKSDSRIETGSSLHECFKLPQERGSFTLPFEVQNAATHEKTPLKTHTGEGMPNGELFVYVCVFAKKKRRFSAITREECVETLKLSRQNYSRVENK